MSDTLDSEVLTAAGASGVVRRVTSAKLEQATIASSFASLPGPRPDCSLESANTEKESQHSMADARGTATRIDTQEQYHSLRHIYIEHDMGASIASQCT